MKMYKFIFPFIYSAFLLSVYDDVQICISLNKLNGNVPSVFKVYFRKFNWESNDPDFIIFNSYEYLGFTKSDLIEIAVAKIMEDKVESHYKAEYFYQAWDLLIFANNKLMSDAICKNILTGIFTENNLIDLCNSYNFNFEKFKIKLENFQRVKENIKVPPIYCCTIL